jgi:uncharacterized membrane protein
MYRGPHATRTLPPRFLRALPWVFAGVTIGAQIAWSLTEPPARETLTLVVVVTFALASVTHAAIWRGVGWTLGFVAIVLVVSSAAEILGVNTGIPFGRYEYTDALTPTVFGVPVIIPLAWLMMAYPVFVLARTIAKAWWLVALVGALAMTSWDLFLDPQMVGANYWSWAEAGLSVPGLEQIPWSNFVGWFAVSLIMMLLLDLLPVTRGSTLLPGFLYAWTWLGGIISNLIVFDRPYVALWGGVAMGVFLAAFVFRSLTTQNSIFSN